jgi:hypothetical protein
MDILNHQFSIKLLIFLKSNSHAKMAPDNGKRKLPFFLDPIEGRLKIERSSLLSAYFNRQVEAERNCDL